MARKPRPKTSQARQGRPPLLSKMTPQRLQELHRLYLQGWSMYRLAARFGVCEKTIQAHIDGKLRPQWQERLRERFDEEVAKVEYLEQTAWRHFRRSLKPQTKQKIEKALVEGGADLKVVKRSLERVRSTGQVAYLEVVRWCRDYFAKVGGYYRSDPLSPHVSEEPQVRPNVVTIVIADREQHRAALRLEEFARLAQEQQLPGAGALDVPSTEDKSDG